MGKSASTVYREHRLPPSRTGPHPRALLDRGWARITRIRDDGDARIWLSARQKALWRPELLHIRTHPRPSAVESPFWLRFWFSPFSDGVELVNIPSGKPLQHIKERLREIEGALCLLQRSAAHRMRIDHRCANITVPQQLLDRPNIVVCPQQMTCETVTKRMTRHALVDSRPFDGPT